MLFRPLFFIFLIVNSDAQRFGSARYMLQHHLDVFQQFVDAGNKKWLRVMMPVKHNSDQELDDFIKAHKSMKLTAKSAKYSGTGNSQSGISGVVEYARGGATILLEMVIEKNRSSLSSYMFTSVRPVSVPSQRNFHVCLVGFLWCYLWLVDVMPPSVEDVFGK
ncbi:FAD-oxidase_C domain-containing protein [Caenorhabditis elegans]|uniref:FAD-oxidase_C domain-containing protein n=1 Tax=Caenorhabditis elegans TaxID=6239 RepID=Q9N4A2_CAEEL|nr:FAD-oxidase_C domain-containing protein [Caenorhabditis elegans]CCD72977.1 FAD-oxidase_C domain-containing protein [Caenorhabditis elegans]|eukprot:NP_494382.1 Uncharacterized protein CELE_Y110A2AL.7 [Caenorhabditis elegans]